MELSFHEAYADKTAGVLLYSILIDPDKPLTRIRTIKYGFKNVTSERNASHLCLYLVEMNALADGKVFRVDEICGFEYAQLRNESKHWLIVRLGKYNLVEMEIQREKNLN